MPTPQSTPQPTPQPTPSPQSTAGEPQDDQLTEQLAMLRRAIDDQGPLSIRDLAETVAAQYWENGVFEQALTTALADGRLVRTTDGRVAAP